MDKIKLEIAISMVWITLEVIVGLSPPGYDHCCLICAGKAQGGAVCSCPSITSEGPRNQSGRR